MSGDEQVEDNAFKARVDMASEAFASEFLGTSLYAVSQEQRELLVKAMSKALQAADLAAEPANG
jgi:hypothetical protein